MPMFEFSYFYGIFSVHERLRLARVGFAHAHATSPFFVALSPSSRFSQVKGTILELKGRIVPLVDGTCSPLTSTMEYSVYWQYQGWKGGFKQYIHSRYISAPTPFPSAQNQLTDKCNESVAYH